MDIPGEFVFLFHQDLELDPVVGPGGLHGLVIGSDKAVHGVRPAVHLA